MSWFTPKPEKPLREQLIEARDALIGQIAILDVGPIKWEPGATEYMQAQAVSLRETLGEIEGELAKLELPMPKGLGGEKRPGDVIGAANMVAKIATI